MAEMLETFKVGRYCPHGRIGPVGQYFAFGRTGVMTAGGENCNTFCEYNRGVITKDDKDMVLCARRALHSVIRSDLYDIKKLIALTTYYYPPHYIHDSYKLHHYACTMSVREHLKIYLPERDFSGSGSGEGFRIPEFVKQFRKTFHINVPQESERELRKIMADYDNQVKGVMFWAIPYIKNSLKLVKV